MLSSPLTGGTRSGASRLRRPAVIVGAVLALALSVVGAGAGIWLGRQAEGLATSSRSATPVPLPQLSPGNQPPNPGTIAALARAALPSVVSLQVVSGSDRAGGSGFVIDASGLILTNNHVISAAAANPDLSTIEVELFDGRRFVARLVGRNVSYDLAVLRIDVSGLTALPWGVDGVRVGDSVVAIGAPLGLSGTVTSGIVSSVDRPVTTGTGSNEESFISALQTDAPINPGNSGGPLLDGRGRVIGVNSAIATLALGGSQGSIGLGFAIPAAQAQRVAQEIIATGSAQTPIIGVVLVDSYPGPGALVQSVTPGGPADSAGIRAGDFILEIDGQPVADARGLIIDIRTNAPGDTLDLTIRRGDVRQTIPVTLAADDRE